MGELTSEELFILTKLEENKGSLNYKDLQSFCDDEFEGVRLILKKLKEKGLIQFEGLIPGFSDVIKLT